MTSLAFIVGTLIIGICLIGGAFIISGAVTGAAAVSKESSPQALQQPTLSFLTEYDAADYIGISLNELDYMRGEGMLDDTFIAVTSLEQTGEEEYYETVDGVETLRTRAIKSPVTRFLFNRQLLDERLLELIKEGQHINPTRGRSNYKQNKQNKKPVQGGQQKQEKPVQKSNGENRPEQKRRPDDSNRPKKNGNGQKPSNNGNGNPQKKPRDGMNKPARPVYDDEDDGFGKPFKPVKPAYDDEDDGFGKPAPKPAKHVFDEEDDGFGVSSSPSIVYDDDDE